MKAFFVRLFVLTLEDILADLTKKVAQLESHAWTKQEEALAHDAAAVASNAAAAEARVVSNRAFNVAAKINTLVS